MYGYWFGMSFFWWVFWVAVIVAFFAFLTPVSRSRSRSRSLDPLDILKRRYAAGELTTAEYDERRARLLEPTIGREAPRPTAPPPTATRPAEGASPREYTHH